MTQPRSKRGRTTSEKRRDDDDGGGVEGEETGRREAKKKGGGRGETKTKRDGREPQAKEEGKGAFPNAEAARQNTRRTKRRKNTRKRRKNTRKRRTRTTSFSFFFFSARSFVPLSPLQKSSRRLASPACVCVCVCARAHTWPASSVSLLSFHDTHAHASKGGGEGACARPVLGSCFRSGSKLVGSLRCGCSRKGDVRLIFRFMPSYRCQVCVSLWLLCVFFVRLVKSLSGSVGGRLLSYWIFSFFFFFLFFPQKLSAVAFCLTHTQKRRLHPSPLSRSGLYTKAPRQNRGRHTPPQEPSPSHPTRPPPGSPCQPLTPKNCLRTMRTGAYRTPSDLVVLASTSSTDCMCLLTHSYVMKVMA